MIRTPYAAHNNYGDLRAAADIVEEFDALTTYLGFCTPGTSGTDAESWSIMRISQNGTTAPVLTIFEWADGLCSFNLIWDNRANYDYSFRKF